MKRVIACLAITFAMGAQDSQPIRGFPQNQWTSEHELEKKALAIPEPDRIRSYMERMAREPHHAGSAADAAVAQYAQGLLMEFGLDVHTEEFEAMLPYPTERVLELTGPMKYTAALKETAIADDRYSSQPGQLPTYNAYSATGDVTGQLVYVNYGSVEDYDYLAKQGIDLKGKIVIARYGRNFRGVKPKLAAEHGAIGCIIYSDPRDDGYFLGDIYPKGGLRPPQGVQRGSVEDLGAYPGDPLSPGWASEKGSKRLRIDEATNLQKIPVTPISYADATPLLQNLGGPVAPESWRGALGFTYHVGPGPATVHLKLNFDQSTRPLHDVIATIPGSTYPDEWVIFGNHHDAWVNGAHDPISGASALLETARTLAALQKQGWRPKRTIVLALWDGEEFGLIGSTEWAEKHADELSRKAVAYINTDSNGQGRLSIGGSHTLEQFVTEVLRDVQDPKEKTSLLEAVRRQRSRPDQAQDENRSREFHLGPLGSGSDYTAFIDHLGIASLNPGFGGPDLGGVYHSVYDDFDWYTRFGDPNFLYERALSQLTTISLLRLADAPLLPFEFGDFTRTVRTYVDELKKQAGMKVDLEPIAAALAKLDTASKAYESALAKGLPRLSSRQLQDVNAVLYQSERAMLLPQGLPGREWYRHAIYAPGFYTGYGAKTLPGVREAIEGSRWDEANREARSAAEALQRLNEHIDTATRLLSGS